MWQSTDMKEFRISIVTAKRSCALRVNCEFLSMSVFPLLGRNSQCRAFSRDFSLMSFCRWSVFLYSANWVLDSTSELISVINGQLYRFHLKKTAK